jgi:hypothetical protein
LGVATARERAVSFLYRELELLTSLDDHAGDTDETTPEREGRVAGALGALRAVELLDADEAEAWRRRLLGAGVERPAPSDTARRAAGELLHGLLETVPEGDDSRGDDFMRFKGAVDALQAVRAASGEWDDRLFRRMGWPTADEIARLNAGGTQKELRAVLPGPAEAIEGVRVLCALRFDDGVSLLLRRENGADRFEDDPCDFELVDDVGTTYSLAGAGGGVRELRITYRTPAPADATWLELRRGASRPIRIPL